MLTPEEAQILKYLRSRNGATLADVARLGLGGAPVEWACRAVANLDWLGYVTVFGLGVSAALFLTDRGRAAPV